MDNLPKLLSGRIPVTPYDNLSADRYQFLGISEAEPNLGAGANNTVLTITTNNVRSWSNSLSLTGNISGDYILGNGSQLTGINANKIFNGNSYANIATAGGNLVIGINGLEWTFGTNGGLTAPGNISTAGYYYGNGRYLTGVIPATNIINQTINGNNVANTFVLDQSASANTVLVSINGITQTPDVDYDVAGNSITFSTAPNNGDVVQIRFLAVAGPGGGGGPANTGNVTFDNINIIGDGNLHLQPDPANSSAYLDVYLTGGAGPDIHIAGNGENVIVGRDAGANVLVAIDGTVSIQADAGTPYTWTFGYNGLVNLPDGTDMGAVEGANTFGFYTSDNTLEYLFEGPNNVTWGFNVGTGGTGFPTLTTQRGDNPSGTITGQTLLFGDATQEAVITTPDGSNTDGINSQRLVINPGKGEDSNGGEGGDIYLWAGRGGDNSGSGGDVKIRGGFAPADGTGGYIRMDGGESQGQGAPGFIEITGGQGGNTTGGYVQITGGVGGNGRGGSVDLYGGFGLAGPGADVTITGGGSANGLAEYGNVNINAGASSWQFDNTGNLTLPGNTFAIRYANNTPVSTSTQGTTGAQGTQGTTGSQGTTGAGTQGTNGAQGTQGTTGSQGTTGAGTQGTNGSQGTQGTTGSLSSTGNIVGSQANVTLVAGLYSTVFDNTGNLTLPGNTFAINYANNTPVNAVTRFESFWTVPTGNSTQSFTVSPSETYYMWVDCNIPNGILTWNATATVTNTNVPVVGAQYAWVYSGGGTPIDFTSIPNQFVGTANTIIRSSTAPSATTNRFDFGINNTSGSAQTVRYGWIAIS